MNMATWNSRVMGGRDHALPRVETMSSAWPWNEYLRFKVVVGGWGGAEGGEMGGGGGKTEC